MNTIVRCCFISFAFIWLYYAEGVEDYKHHQNYQKPASIEAPKVVKKPKSVGKLSEASNPEYDISKAQFRVKHHPRIHLQAPEVRFVFPPRRKPTYNSYPRNYHYYGSGFANDYPQYYPHYDLYDYDRFPRFQMISPPGVWMDQARHSLYAPKVRVKRPPQYPVEPKVEEETTAQIKQENVKQVKEEPILNKNPTEYQIYTEPYNGVVQQ